MKCLHKYWFKPEYNSLSTLSGCVWHALAWTQLQNCSIQWHRHCWCFAQSSSNYKMVKLDQIAIFPFVGVEWQTARDRVKFSLHDSVNSGSPSTAWSFFVFWGSTALRCFCTFWANRSFLIKRNSSTSLLLLHGIAKNLSAVLTARPEGLAHSAWVQLQANPRFFTLTSSPQFEWTWTEDGLNVITWWSWAERFAAASLPTNPLHIQQLHSSQDRNSD